MAWHLGAEASTEQLAMALANETDGAGAAKQAYFLASDELVFA